MKQIENQNSYIYSNKVICLPWTYIDFVPYGLQKKQNLERLNGTSSPHGTGNTQMGRGPIEQPCRVTGRPQGQTSPFTVDSNMWVSRKPLCFTRGSHQRALRLIGSCMSIG